MHKFIVVVILKRKAFLDDLEDLGELEELIATRKKALAKN